MGFLYSAYLSHNTQPTAQLQPVRAEFRVQPYASSAEAVTLTDTVSWMEEDVLQKTKFFLK